MLSHERRQPTLGRKPSHPDGVIDHVTGVVDDILDAHVDIRVEPCSAPPPGNTPAGEARACSSRRTRSEPASCVCAPDRRRTRASTHVSRRLRRPGETDPGGALRPGAAPGRRLRHAHSEGHRPHGEQSRTSHCACDMNIRPAGRMPWPMVQECGGLVRAAPVAGTFSPGRRRVGVTMETMEGDLAITPSSWASMGRRRRSKRCIGPPKRPSAEGARSRRRPRGRCLPRSTRTTGSPAAHPSRQRLGRPRRCHRLGRGGRRGPAGRLSSLDHRRRCAGPAAGLAMPISSWSDRGSRRLPGLRWARSASAA